MYCIITNNIHILCFYSITGRKPSDRLFLGLWLLWLDRDKSLLLTTD